MANPEPTKSDQAPTYRAPTLIRYGDVASLTANGSKPGKEDNTGNIQGTPMA